MKLNARKQRISPLKDKPLRNPGQSLDEELQRLLDEIDNKRQRLTPEDVKLAAYRLSRYIRTS
ncbi:hypothetical protein IQ254_18900 [Nodosilinea sp. LEGE 07088]|uniref:hypothetical protein n=1 Tax=Nodosilinea sp. LEGE 07088 TaxID=2777968 RepID=UPI00187E0764|nr:hypothetical protein [Nodosilinea sp. LEGE 07088]MBE9139240.1 hypothetical protein [Nodosilinea sp. LEGE 07088]